MSNIRSFICKYLIAPSKKYLISPLSNSVRYCKNLYKYRFFYPLPNLKIRTYILAVLIACIPGLFIYLSEIINTFYIYNSALWIKSKTELGHSISIIAILFATIGWVITVRSNRHLSKIQHTVNILLEHSFSNEARGHAITLYTYVPGDAPLIKENVDSLFENRKHQAGKALYDPTSNELPSEKATYNSIRAMLNYFEFLAIGMKMGDVDTKMIKDFFHVIICEYCEKTKMFIKKCNDTESLEYENLIELYRAWKPSDTFPAN